MSHPTSVAEWLTTVGLPEYAVRFAENDIDLSVLVHLTDQDLKELGVSLGHRRKLRRDPPPGVSPDEAVAAVRDVLDTIGDTCPECPPDAP